MLLEKALHLSFLHLVLKCIPMQVLKKVSLHCVHDPQKLQALRSLKRAPNKDYGMHLILQDDMTYHTEVSGPHG